MEFVMNIILSSVRMATPLIFLALAELYGAVFTQIRRAQKRKARAAKRNHK